MDGFRFLSRLKAGTSTERQTMTTHCGLSRTGLGRCEGNSHGAGKRGAA
jgi:hypothetical protein